MKQTNTDREQELIEIRQTDVKKLWSQGLTFREIAIELNIGVATAWRDLDDIKKQAKRGISKSIENDLPIEFEEAKTGLKEIIKAQWKTYRESTDERAKTVALALAKECILAKFDLHMQAKLIDRAIQVIKTHRKIKRKLVLEEEIDLEANQNTESSNDNDGVQRIS